MIKKRIFCLMLAVAMSLSAFMVNISAVESENYSVSLDLLQDEVQRLLGDTDNSATVNIKDATLIQKCIAGISTLDEVSMIYADTNIDGSVNVKDATRIQKYVADIFVNTAVGYPYDANPETYRYYFYMPEDWLNEFTATTGNTAGIYWWEGTNAHIAWPGIPAKKADAEGVYYYDVPTDVTTIIWNNFFDGGMDRDAPGYFDAKQTCNIGTEYYDPGESELYPEGTENFNGMIYVIDPTIYPCCDYNNKLVGYGEWFYYYGNGEYGTSPIRGESEIFTDSILNRDTTGYWE